MPSADSINYTELFIFRYHSARTPSFFNVLTSYLAYEGLSLPSSAPHQPLTNPFLALG